MNADSPMDVPSPVDLRTMADARELHAPSLYQAVRSLLRRGGVFLMCDHFIGPGGMIDEALYMTPEEHKHALATGGFAQVDLLLRKGGLILFRATA